MVIFSPTFIIIIFHFHRKIYYCMFLCCLETFRCVMIWKLRTPSKNFEFESYQMFININIPFNSFFGLNIPWTCFKI